MKVLLLFGVAFVPHLAFANAQLPAGLGQTKAIYDYCSQIDPADTATFGKMWGYAAGGNTSLVHAAGFQQIYDSTITRLKALPKSATASGCHGGASQWTGVHHEVGDLRTVRAPGPIKDREVEDPKTVRAPGPIKAHL